MRGAITLLGGILMAGVVGILIAFVILNWFLGCESWNEQYWTATNSCITPSQIWRGITNG
jgi:FtsH-binding integral membrane protein